MMNLRYNYNLTSPKQGRLGRVLLTVLCLMKASVGV